MQLFIKKWGWILLWALLSVIAAIIIHLLFSLPASTDYCVATWGSGDILTYISTVSLGLLAMWQTQKIHYNNEKAEKNKLAIDKYVLFEFDAVSAVFDYSEDDKPRRPAKIIEGGFNGNKAIWKLQSMLTYRELHIEITIKNISSYPAISPELWEKEKKASGCNVLCGEPNNRHYIPANGEGTMMLS